VGRGERLPAAAVGRSTFLKRVVVVVVVVVTYEEDRLGWVRTCTDEEDVIISTRKGYTMRFHSADLRATGRTARGCRALTLRKSDEMVDCDILPPGQDEDISYLLAVTTSGFGKRVSASSFRPQKRGGMGVISIKFKAGTEDTLACMRSCRDDDDVVLTTQRGTIVRQRVRDISVQGRTATGVRVQRLDVGNHIMSVAIVPAEDSKDEDESQSDAANMEAAERDAPARPNVAASVP